MQRRLVVVLLGVALLMGGVTGPASAAANPETNQWTFVADENLGFAGINTAKDDKDPENEANRVISFDTDPGTYADGSFAVGAVTTRLRRTRIDDLDNQVELKYYFAGGRTCAGGSPRISLSIDEDGDGASDGAAFGYLGDQAFGGGCPTGQWVFEDMTNSAPKWDLSQFGGPVSANWASVEAFFNAFPTHKVLRGTLSDDAASFAPTTVGCAYFDSLTIGDSHLGNSKDTRGPGNQTQNNC